MPTLDPLDILFVAWAFFYQVAHMAHFMLRKRYFESYTLKWGWLVYALCIPAAVVSLILLAAGKVWWFWLGGFLCVAYSAFGYWVDYVRKAQWRNPPNWSYLGPYVTLYLATVMFYWWPLARLGLALWAVAAVLFVINTVLNVRSH